MSKNYSSTGNLHLLIGNWVQLLGDVFFNQTCREGASACIGHVFKRNFILFCFLSMNGRVSKCARMDLKSWEVGTTAVNFEEQWDLQCHCLPVGSQRNWDWELGFGFWCSPGPGGCFAGSWGGDVHFWTWQIKNHRKYCHETEFLQMTFKSSKRKCYILAKWTSYCS